MNKLMRSNNTFDFGQSEEKVSSISTAYLSVAEVANLLGKTKKTITEWCRTGVLPAVSKPYGNKMTYQVTPKAVKMFLESQKNLSAAISTKKQIDNYEPYLQDWKKAMEAGLMTGRGFSPHTVRHYFSYMTLFINRYKVLNLQNVREELASIPPIQFSKRSKFHRAVISFAKYLHREKLLEKKLLDDLMDKSLYPKRMKPPRQATVPEDHLEILISACTTPMTRALVMVLANTGMRADECAQLNLKDIDLEKKEVVILHGKGGKTRTLGLNDATVEAIKQYLQYRPQVKTESLFLSRFNDRIRRDCIYQRIKKIAKKSGIDASPHALRRRFVTFHLNTGKNPKKVQMACGHSNINTTMMYNRTEERDVVDDMKSW